MVLHFRGFKGGKFPPFFYKFDKNIINFFIIVMFKFVFGLIPPQRARARLRARARNVSCH